MQLRTAVQEPRFSKLQAPEFQDRGIRAEATVTPAEVLGGSADV